MAISADDDYDCLCKVVLVGDVSVGKTHLLSRYMKDDLPKAPAATIGVEFATKTVRLTASGVNVKAQIWDTAGQERYRAITRAHYRRAAGAIMVYDVTRSETFRSCASWVQEVREGASPDAVIVLVGNKIDLVEQDPSLRQVYHDVAQEFARQHGLHFVEASAVSGMNVRDAFEQLLEEVYSKAPKESKGQLFTSGGMSIDKSAAGIKSISSGSFGAPGDSRNFQEAFVQLSRGFKTKSRHWLVGTASVAEGKSLALAPVMEAAKRSLRANSALAVGTPADECCTSATARNKLCANDGYVCYWRNFPGDLLGTGTAAHLGFLDDVVVPIIESLFTAALRRAGPRITGVGPPDCRFTASQQDVVNEIEEIGKFFARKESVQVSLREAFTKGYHLRDRDGTLAEGLLPTPVRNDFPGDPQDVAWHMQKMQEDYRWHGIEVRMSTAAKTLHWVDMSDDDTLEVGYVVIDSQPLEPTRAEVFSPTWTDADDAALDEAWVLAAEERAAQETEVQASAETCSAAHKPPTHEVSTQANALCVASQRRTWHPQHVHVLLRLLATSPAWALAAKDDAAELLQAVVSTAAHQRVWKASNKDCKKWLRTHRVPLILFGQRAHVDHQNFLPGVSVARTAEVGLLLLTDTQGQQLQGDHFANQRHTNFFRLRLLRLEPTLGPAPTSRFTHEMI
ncbi:Ras-related protein YPTC6 [Symbiodinium microadriaticum]|uniref:Ras-related protein YPTC6 n=1 Tax=Symbiodinium microadriaticum TaxID=2951 RepID=A0A1Q9E457_SYMMI|nr:Ras-related protein YPTC6 [Symbiodinium microadriaticum]